MGLTKQQLEALNDSSFPNNTAGLITPQVLRDYNDAVIGNTVNQDTYTTDSASFSQRIAAGGDINTSSFATTGSNTFVGDQTVTGSIIGNSNINIYSQFPGISLRGNAVGSGSQYPFAELVLDSETHSSEGVIGAWVVADPSTSQSVGMGINTYTNVYGYPNPVPVIYGQGALFGTDDTLIGFPAGKIDLWRNTDLHNNLIVSGTATFSELSGSLGSFSASISSRINSVTGSGGTINTSSLATTGSNTFVGDQYISNGTLQVATYPQTGKTWFAPTAIEAVGTASVAYEQFVDGGGYDAFNVVTTLDSGSEFRDLPSDTFVLNTWLQIPRNTGNNPAPQFKRGLGITGSVNVSGSIIGANNLITTGSAVLASQAISGGFEFNTKYTAANPYVTQVGGGTTLEISYGDIFNGTKNGNDFIFWLDTNFAGVSVTGSGITNGAITGYNYGAGVEVSITTGTITNGATYTFTGPAQGIVEVTGSLHATKELVVNGAYDARKAVADANGFYSVDASGLAQAGASLDGGAYAGNNSNGNYINLAATSSQVNSNSGPTPFDKPQIAVTQNNNGRFTQISFQGNNDYTDGRITSHQPFEVSSSMDFYAHGHKQFNVGAFQSNITQSGSANVSQSMQFQTTDISHGVSIVSGSRITLANSGIYNIQFSAQVDRVSGSGTDTVHIWLKKNGSNVTASAGAVTISGAASAAKAIAAWNYVVDANANDYYELAWQTTDSNIQLINQAATGNIPSTPSIILTVTQPR